MRKKLNPASKTWLVATPRTRNNLSPISNQRPNQNSAFFHGLNDRSKEINMNSGRRIFPPLTSGSFSGVAQNNDKRPPAFSETVIRPERPVVEPAASLPANTSVPSDAEAEKAFYTLLKWLGDDPEREGLKDTPARVVRGWKEFFAGYKEDPKDHLKKTFANEEGYNDMVCLENIRLESYCEHHLVPITGAAFVAYVPGDRVAGLSKLARVVEGYARRLQIQEKLTRQILRAMDEMLAPKGVAVAIRSEHQCLSTRGAYQPSAEMFTLATSGVFETDPQKKAEFLALVNRGR
jgi:GTP cyclohydrolase I